MDDTATFGTVFDRDTKRPRKWKSRSPKIRLIEEWNECITHWCTPCRCWHGPRCATDYLAAQAGEDE